MSNLNEIIKDIQLDDEKRILISMKNEFESYLQDEKTRSMLKESAQGVLKDDFIQLEIGKNICRLTVKEGTEDKNLELVKDELAKGLEMMMAFLTLMQGQQGQ